MFSGCHLDVINSCYFQFGALSHLCSCLHWMGSLPPSLMRLCSYCCCLLPLMGAGVWVEGGLRLSARAPDTFWGSSFPIMFSVLPKKVQYQITITNKKPHLDRPKKDHRIKKTNFPALFGHGPTISFCTGPHKLCSWPWKKNVSR
jgi:hypothetical protein